MGPDLAQIVISAVDKTGEAFTYVKTSMKQMELGGASEQRALIALDLTFRKVMTDGA